MNKDTIRVKNRRKEPFLNEYSNPEQKLTKLKIKEADRSTPSVNITCNHNLLGVQAPNWYMTIRSINRQIEETLNAETRGQPLFTKHSIYFRAGDENNLYITRDNYKTINELIIIPYKKLREYAQTGSYAVKTNLLDKIESDTFTLDSIEKRKQNNKRNALTNLP